MRVLKPEYRDRRTCTKCGAPAEIIGHFYDEVTAGHNVSTFRPAPVTANGRGERTHICHACCAALDYSQTTVVVEAKMPPQCFFETEQAPYTTDRKTLAAGDS